MCLFDSDWFLISEMAFFVFELLASRSGVLFQWMESLVFLLILWFLFCFLQSYSGFTQKWIIILQEFYVIDMKHTLKVMTIKKSGWPKSSSYINILMNKTIGLQIRPVSSLLWQRSCPSAVCMNLSRVWKRSYIFLLHITDTRFCVCLVFQLLFRQTAQCVVCGQVSRQPLMSGQKESSPDSFNLSSFWPNPYLSQSITKGSRVSFHFSFLLYCSWWCIDLSPCRYKND